MRQESKDITRESPSVRWMATIITGLLFILPLLYASGYGSYLAVRYFAFGSVALILGILMTWTFIRRRWLVTELFRSAPIYGLVLYLLSFMLVSALSAYPSLSFFSTFQRADGAFTLLFLSLFALSIYTVLRLTGDHMMYRFCAASVFGASIFSLLLILSPDGVSLLTGGLFEHHRGGATIGNSSLAVLYVIWNICFAVALLKNASGVKRKIGWAALTALTLISPLFMNWRVVLGQDAFTGLHSLLGDARGGLLGLFIGAVVALGIWLATDGIVRVRAWAGRVVLVICGLLVVTGSLLLLQKSSLVHRAFTEVVSGTRFIFWESAQKGFEQRPVSGWGPNTFGEVYHRNLSADIYLPENKLELFVDRPHNIIFETLVGGGVILLVGLAAFLSSIVLVLIRLARRRRFFAALLLGALSAWFIQVQFIFDSIASMALLFMVFGVGLAEEGRRRFQMRAGQTAQAAPGKSGDNKTRMGWTPLTVASKTVMVLACVASIALFWYAIFLPARKAHVMSRVYQMNLPARADAWQSLSGISPMGDHYDSALLFREIYEEYEKNVARIRDGDPLLRSVVIDELDAVSGYVSNLLALRGEQYDLVLIAAQLYSVRLLIDVDAPREIEESAQRLAERAAELSPVDSRPQELLTMLKKIRLGRDVLK